MVDLWQLEPGEVVYAPLPLFHLSAVGSVLGPMLAGGTGVLELDLQRVGHLGSGPPLRGVGDRTGRAPW